MFQTTEQTTDDGIAMPRPRHLRNQWRTVHVRVAVMATVAVACAAVIALTLNTPLFDTVEDHEILMMIVIALAVCLLMLGVMFYAQRSVLRRAEQAETLFCTLSDSIDDGFVLYDTKNRPIGANAAIQTLPKQHDTDEVRAAFAAAKTFDDIVDTYIASGCIQSPTPNVCRTHWKTAFESGEGAFEFQLSDGRWQLARYRKVPDVGTIGMRSDITALKNRERVIQDNAARYREMIERSSVPIYVHRNNIILYANHATAQLLGYASPLDLIGKNNLDLVHSDHRKLAKDRCAIALTTDKPLPQVEIKLLKADGSSLTVEARVCSITYGGEPAHESILYDVSDRVRNQEAVAESERRYRNLFELSPDAILIHDDSHILFANAAAARMFATDDDIGLIGIPLAMVSEDDCIAFDNISASSPRHCRMKALNGTIFDADILTGATHYRGQAVYQTVVRDVTERARMEETLAQNAKLAALGSMAAGLAHEISQPLNVIRFTAEGSLLKLSQNGLDTDAHRENYGLVAAQCARMAAIMDGVQTFSRKKIAPAQPFDVALSVRNICNMLRNTYRADDVHIFTNGPFSQLFAVGHELPFEQVVMNLLKNAYDAILEHRNDDDDMPGRIQVDIGLDSAETSIVVTVSDNGGGIHQDVQDRIFDPFFTTKAMGKGTGLGLSLSQDIIAAMNGTLGGHNTDDGATFNITLPLCAPAAMPTPDASTNSAGSRPDEGRDDRAVYPEHHPRRILVVDDEVDAAHLMAEFLQSIGHAVTVAYSGQGGLEAFHRVHPDLVITDIRMPGMDGNALIRAIQSLDDHQAIIAVSGHLQEGDTVETEPGKPSVPILKKPLSLGTLAKIIADTPFSGESHPLQRNIA